MSYIENSQTSTELISALLMYGDRNGVLTHASLHNVNRGIIQPSTAPLTMDALHTLEEGLRKGLSESPRPTNGLAIWPENILFHDTRRRIIAWHVPAQKMLQRFNNADLGNRKASLFLPSFVLVQKEASLSICSVKSKDRPQGNSPTFHAPLFNTYENGDVCLGGIRLPFPETPEQLLQNQQQFFAGVNTHPNGNHSKTKYKFGIYALWKKLLDKPATPWRDIWLTPKGLTLSDWLAKVGA